MLKSPLDKWRKFCRLTGQERSALACSALLLPLIALGLRLLGFRRLQVALAKVVPNHEPGLEGRSESRRGEVEVVVRMVAAASREGLVHGNCLEQSLTLWWLLRRRDVPAQLRIGVQKQGDQFQAHAWVELAGAVLNDRDDAHQEYTAFARDLGVLGMDMR